VPLAALWRLLQITKSGSQVVANIGDGGLQLARPAMPLSLRDDMRRIRCPTRRRTRDGALLSDKPSRTEAGPPIQKAMVSAVLKLLDAPVARGGARGLVVVLQEIAQRP
jgi:hypothetical protein